MCRCMMERYLVLKNFQKNITHSIRAAIPSLNEAEKNGKVLTGLLYINPEVKDHTEILNISDTPLINFLIKIYAQDQTSLQKLMQA